MIGVVGAALLMMLGMGSLASLFEDEPQTEEGEDQDFDQDLGNDSDGSDPATDLLTGETIAGTDQPDLLELTAGVDSLSGEAGDDTLTGTHADHWVESDLENSTLDGGSGDDTLILTDHITAIGGEGSDTFVLGSSEYTEGNTITDFEPGVDTISVDLEGETALPELRIEDTEDGNAEIYADDALLTRITGAAGQITTNEIEFLNADFIEEGTDADDTLSGGEGADTLDGAGGNDLIRLGDGDTGLGGDGSDTFEVNGDPSGEITILDFSPAEDVLMIEYYSAEGTWPAPELEVTQTAGGDTLVTSDTGLNITLRGAVPGFTLDNVILVET